MTSRDPAVANVASDISNLNNRLGIAESYVSNNTFTYKVGDTGPGGGVIFFVDRFNEHSDFTYLEVAPSSTEVARSWATNINSNQTTSVAGADSRALGGGHQNTIDIVAQEGNVAVTCAAAYCADLTSGGQSDWYLPSLAELVLIYRVVHLDLGTGSFLNSNYWASTESPTSPDGAAVVGFISGGAAINTAKSTSARVRAIRRF